MHVLPAYKHFRAISHLIFDNRNSWSLFFIFRTVPHSARISRFRRATQRMIR